jgi:type II secretory pathway component GspD/PulD (secretin)
VAPERERWAEALAIDRQYGDQAHVRIDERIGALAVQGDMAGVDRWKQIAARLHQLSRGGMQRPDRITVEAWIVLTIMALSFVVEVIG